MSNKYFLKEAWSKYKSDIIPKNASDTQISETKKAFYSGAMCLFIILNKNIDEGTEPTEKDLSLLDNITIEFDEYRKELAKNKMS